MEGKENIKTMSFISWDRHISFDPGDPPEADDEPENDPVMNMTIHKKEFVSLVRDILDHSHRYQISLNRKPVAVILDWSSFVLLYNGENLDRVDGWKTKQMVLDFFMLDINKEFTWRGMTIYPDFMCNTRMVVIGG